jgi:hypothetical protein
MTDSGRRGERETICFFDARVNSSERPVTPGGKVARSRKRSSAITVFLLAACLAAGLSASGCGSSANPNVPTPLIAVAITPVPAGTSVPLQGTLTLTAAVTNDAANAGVDWVVTCNKQDGYVTCGDFSPRHTASGAPTTFTAPDMVASKGVVTITAISTTDNGKRDSVTIGLTSPITGITITSFPQSLPAGAQGSATAVVAGEPQAGPAVAVNWSVSCNTNFNPGGIPECGGFFDANGTASTTSANGAPIFYRAPVDLPNDLMVTIKATSNVDPNFSTTVTVVITAQIVLAVTAPPPSSMAAGATATIIASVANDTTNSGLTWILQCANTPCGSLTSLTTTSGQPNTLTAPTTPLSGDLVLTIFATADSSARQQFNIAINYPITAVNITQQPAATLAVGGTTQAAATAVGDTKNAGIDWSAQCGSAPCGSFSPKHTDNGALTTYTAPAVVPTGGTVTLVATSTADPTKSATTTPITISGATKGPFSGQLVFVLTGADTNNLFYFAFGTIVGDGNGHINGGDVIVADASGLTAPVTPTGTYTIGTDGRGQVVITNFSTPSGSSFSFTMSVDFVSPTHALISESDSFANATGTLDAQNAADLAAFTAAGGTTLSGQYALILSGAPLGTPGPKSVFLASALTFVNGTETAVQGDQSNSGTIIFGTSNPTLPYTPTYAASPFGHILTATSFQPAQTVAASVGDVFLIDKNHFVVSFEDNNNSFFAVGVMVAQPASPSITGAYGFTETGLTTFNSSATPPTVSQVAGGMFTCGSTPGVLDVVSLGGGPALNQPFSNAACTAPNGGRGLVTLAANRTGVSQFAAYPTVDMGLQLIELDGGASGTSGPSGAGVALPQTLPTPIAASSFKGTYGSNFLAAVNYPDSTTGFEGFAGSITSNGSSTLTGILDVNALDTSISSTFTSLNSPLTSSTFTAANNGRFLMILTFTPSSSSPDILTTFNPVCYVLDVNTCLLLGTDSTAPGTGILQVPQNIAGIF